MLMQFFLFISRGKTYIARLAIAGLFLVIILTIGQVLPVPTQADNQPPVIDRELFFGDPEISAAQISPDGKFIAFLKPFK
ncbi:hypothetical protein, partial [Salmonella sp. SAL4445]|uniref:hypothetical protein n=1 Tax=Salmonella sp. SAL4445 TaxID=3159900 RepID=UPI00397E7E2C